MKIIKWLEEEIEEEVHGAKCYAKKALELKEDYPEIADSLWMMSNEEMKHMQTLHNIVVKLIEQYRADNGEPPKEMLAVYNYLHEKHIEKAKDVKILQDMYRS